MTCEHVWTAKRLQLLHTCRRPAGHTDHHECVCGMIEVHETQEGA